MNVLYFILLIIVHILIAFIFHYCFDTPELWKGEQCYLSMPTLHDINKGNFYGKPDCLDDVISPYKMQEYLDDVILPAHEYFIKSNQVERMLSKKPSSDICWVVLHIASTILMGRVIKCSSLSWTISALIGFGVGILCSVIALKIYKRTSLPIPSFWDTKEDLQEDFKHHSHRIFGISDEDAFNLFAINRHANYIHSIYETIVFRNTICRVVSTLFILIYFIFRPYED